MELISLAAGIIFAILAFVMVFRALSRRTQEEVNSATSFGIGFAICAAIAFISPALLSI